MLRDKLKKNVARITGSWNVPGDMELKAICSWKPKQRRLLKKYL